MEDRIKSIMDLLRASLSEYKLEEGDVITIMDELHRIRISPYRITLELRFPQGISRNEIDKFHVQHTI